MRILAHIFEAKQAEYIIALLGLFGFIAFWRILNGPTVETEAVRDAVRSFADRFAGFLVPSDVMFPSRSCLGEAGGRGYRNGRHGRFCRKTSRFGGFDFAAQIGIPGKAGIFGLGVQDRFQGDSHAVSGGRRSCGGQLTRRPTPPARLLKILTGTAGCSKSRTTISLPI